MSHMQDQHIESGAESPPRSDLSSQSSPSANPRLRKVMSFVRRHPAVSVLGIAGAGLLAGPELALGVVLGVGVAALIDRKSERRVEEEAVEAARSVRQRARQIFDPETMKQRARAVVQAARGQIPPVSPPAAASQSGQTSPVPPAGQSLTRPEGEVVHSSGL